MHHALYVSVGFDAAGVYFAGIAHQAQNGQVRAVYRVYLHALRRQAFRQLVDFLLLCHGFHNDDHVWFLLT